MTSKRKQRILFIHQNFPGQFKFLAQHFANASAWECLAVGRDHCTGLAGVRTVRYRLHREVTRSTHPYARPYEHAILHGQAVLRLALRLRRAGWIPDVIVAHPGWGETLFIREAFPRARLIHFAEFYYHPSGTDIGFDPEFPASIDARARSRALNALHLLNLQQCDVVVTPTQWQLSLQPQAYRHKVTVVHEGIDCAYMRPDAQASFALPDGTTLHAGDPVVTFVARNLEPYRGFHILMRALPRILAANPACRILIIGGDGVSYGAAPADASDWRSKLCREVPFDPARVHFLGRLAYGDYRRVLQVSAAHIYLTYPFVLSWSMLEAMACACLVIGSRTGPVTDVIEHGSNGLLVDFFDQEALVATVSRALADPGGHTALRAQARRHVSDHYDVRDALRTYCRLIEG